MKTTSIIIFLLVNIPIFANNEPNDTDGNGYRNISTLKQLRWVSENDSSWAWNFELDNDIGAFSTRFWNDFKGWQPIGTSKRPFSGKFNGNGHKVSRLYINRSDEDRIGFFGVAAGKKMEITNFTLENYKIKANDDSGGLVGIARYGNISHCSVSGSIYGASRIAGFISEASGMKIEYCSVDDLKLIVECCGSGFVSDITKDNINNIEDTVRCCCVNGTLRKKNRWVAPEGLGGLIGGPSGFSEVNQGVILNCYSKCKIKGRYIISVFIDNESVGEVKNCYFAGSLYLTTSSHNSINFVRGGSFTIQNCFTDFEATGLDGLSLKTGKTTTEMKTKSTYTNAGWNFETIWDINPKINDGYPFLRNVPMWD